MTGVALRAESVVRVFRGRDGAEVRAVDGATLDVAAGECVAVTGPSGCGKTTLLALLGALDRPTSGRVLHDGQDLGAASEAELARRRRRVGCVFQHAPMVGRLAVWENVTLGLVPLGAGSRERLDLALAALAPLGLEGLARRRPEELSGGERQRAALARALAGEPGLLLADEPTSQLDEASARLVLEALTAAHRRGATLVLATHDPAARAIAGRALGMSAGRLQAPAGSV